MKIAGESVNLPAGDVVVLPRPEGNLIFHIKPVETFEAFDEAHPRPTPPKLLRKGVQQEDFDDPTFQVQVKAWTDLRQSWLMVKALSCPENMIEWERVVMDQPQTWKEVTGELKEAGVIDAEYWYILRKVYAVNALTEESLENARANFLLMTSEELSGE